MVIRVSFTHGTYWQLISSSLIKGRRCFLEQETLLSLLSTG